MSKKYKLVLLILLLLGCSYPIKITLYNGYDFPIQIIYGNSYGYEYFVKSEILHHSSSIEHSDSLFWLNLHYDTLKFDKNEKRTIRSNIQATHTADRYSLKSAIIYDSNKYIIEIIRYSAGLIVMEDSVILPFERNTFRNDKAYKSYIKLVKNDKDFLKYIEAQDLYSHKKYEKVIDLIESINLKIESFGNEDIKKKYGILFDDVFEEHFIGFHTLAILSAYQLKKETLVNKYWNRLKSEFPTRALGIFHYDTEIKMILEKFELN